VGPAALQLLWHDRVGIASVARLEAVVAAPDRGDDWLLPGETVERDGAERLARAAARTLALARPITLDSLGAAAGSACDEDGVFTAPLCVVAAELELSFDAREALRHTATRLSLAGDRRLDELLKAAAAALAAGPPPPAGVLAALQQRLIETHAEGGRRSETDAVVGDIARALLEARAYRTAAILGGDHARASVSEQHGRAVAYLPVDGARALPLRSRLGCRLLVEIHPNQDEAEPGDWVLRILGVGRLLGPLRAAHATG
jgi:hypothetical protein